MSLKVSRQRVADLEQEAALVTKQMEAIGKGALRGSRAMTDVERAELLTLTERRDGLRDDLIAAKAERQAAEDENERDRNWTGDTRDPDAMAAVTAARAAGIHIDDRSAPMDAGSQLAGVGQSPASIVAALYGHTARDTRGFRGATDFLSSVISGRHDPRLMHADTSFGEYSGPLGGFLLTPAIESAIMLRVLENSIFRGRAQFRTMTSSEQIFPAFSTANDAANGTYYGLSREWLPETVSATPQVASLELLKMHANTESIVIKITNQLLQDVAGVEAQLIGLIASAIEHFLDVDCLSGGGVGEPEGVLRSAAAIVVAKEAGQAPDTINYDNVTKMWSRLAPSSASSALWLAPPSALPQLQQMVIVVGTGGSPVQALVESNGKYTLMGRELILTHKVRPVGDEGDLVLFDPQQYLIAIRSGMSVARSEHLGFLSNETYVRVLMRFDGRATWREAYDPGDSHPTVSPYIVLAARA